MKKGDVLRFLSDGCHSMEWTGVLVPVSLSLDYGLFFPKEILSDQGLLQLWLRKIIRWPTSVQLILNMLQVIQSLVHIDMNLTKFIFVPYFEICLQTLQLLQKKTNKNLHRATSMGGLGASSSQILRNLKKLRKKQKRIDSVAARGTEGNGLI